MSAILLLVWSGPALAVQHPQDRVVSADPANFTPHALDGRVNAVVQIGDRIFVGGSFTQVREWDDQTVQTRNRLFSFNASTGRLDAAFAPNMSGEVEALLPAPDGESIYVGGAFGQVNGATNRVLTRLDVANGQVLPGFTPSLSARVLDMRLAGGRLYVGGAFATVSGTPQAALATLDPDTGARDPFVDLAFAGTQNGGTTQILKLDVTPDESRLVAVGNFATVGGQSRRQIVQLDLTGESAEPADWHTARYEAACSSSFNTYMRDVDYSPDGRFFVVTTTGAYAGGPPRLCDTHARWETYASGSNLNPTWVNYTGGDTSYAVSVTPQAVYVGGHFRWANNPFRGDAAGPGAVSRPGLAALDPVNGVPLTWNPTRTLGVGVFDLTATAQGLWVGSDTDRIGNWEYHARLAMFPLSGGAVVQPPFAGVLPADLYQLGAGATPTDTVQRRSYDGTALGAVQPVGAGGTAWSGARGAFMLSGRLYTPWSDGKLYRRTFDGTTFGAPAEVPLNGLTDFAADMQNMTGVFYAHGRLYFTRSGQSSLYYRGFTAESEIVGAQRFTASGNVAGVDFSRVGGMFLSGDKLYFTDRLDGRLLRADFVNGAPVAGTATVLSGPAVDGADWRQRALFMFAGAGTAAPNAAPVAELVPECEELTCTFRNTGSRDPDGTVVATSWTFGGGGGASGAVVRHAFPGSGTYPVTVTVTDDRGATASATANVTVQGANQPPVADFAATCDQLACTFDANPSSDPDGSVTAYAWEFGDGATATGVTASHAYAAAGAYPVKLSVTDDRGVTVSVTKNISVVQPSTEVEFVGSAASNANVTTHSVTVPGQVAGGDGLLLFMTVNSSTVTVPDPAGVTGWALVGTRDNGGVVTKVWKKSAAPDDGGDVLSVTLSGQAKADLTLAAYRGVDLGVVAAQASASETVTRAEHTTPEVQVPAGGGWVVSYWGEKSSATTAWTAPEGQTVRSTQAGTGSGRITSLLTDGGGPVPAGTSPGVTATADAASLRATMWSLVLAPAG
ncbi:PKD domain-containing protein [Planomonospora sp. ID91781]|uniref:PKD domain-containing protein n=1 Tax=Planomonospora sp. ID91781 TaxID=2738135 RepID=UPI0018C3CB4C|nr:PKD domain-containing protein [Planomonospora sp. ID91781]